MIIIKPRDKILNAVESIKLFYASKFYQIPFRGLIFIMFEEKKPWYGTCGIHPKLAIKIRITFYRYEPGVDIDIFYVHDYSYR